mgnify:CR=1 FL=1
MEFLKKAYFFFLDFMQTVLLAASVFLVIYIFLFRPFQVSGESMFSTFKNKEYILTNLVAMRFEEPKRGDVIVFHSPTDKEKDFIKRVIGTPGDSVAVHEGSVYVNGIKLNESVYLDKEIKTYGGAFLRDGADPVLVPDGSYIVMGDNRPYSSDSREWGLLRKDEIIGKSFFVYWPITTARLISNPFDK